MTLKRDCWARHRCQHLDRSARQEATRSSGEPGASVESIQSHSSGPAELVQRVEEARANLAGLKPAERRALGLIAAGYSYREIGQITGWTYTKTNRCAVEGRAALRNGVIG